MLKACSVSIVLFVLVGFCIAHECTVNPDDIRNVRLEAVKREILFKLRLTQPPKNPDPNVPLIIDQSLLAEYRAVVELLNHINGKKKPCTTSDTSSHHLLLFFLTSVEAYVGQEGVIFDLDQGSVVEQDMDKDRAADRYRLNFFINTSNSGIISQAELRVLKRPTNRSNSQPLTDIGEERVELYLIAQPNNFPEFITAQQVSSDTEGYVVFDILTAIEKWVEFDVTNFARELELEILIRLPGPKHLPRIEFVTDNESRHSQVVITTTFKDQPSHRQKKRANDYDFCTSERHDGLSCCVKPFEINFMEDYGWSWLLYPKVLKVNYCEGLCPLALLNNHRAVIDSPGFSNPTSSPDPCCVGSDFSDIAVMLRVNGTFTIETLQGVRVEACSCR